jgi:uncharacterized Zn finger protein (UPF0148 family)
MLETDERCPTCGSPLETPNYDNYYCRACGAEKVPSTERTHLPDAEGNPRTGARNSQTR